ncbi:phosphotransferase enzyme family protein [Polluticaenibacter yanchengensis]|uniref:Aminoglycoside phosphotransferase family protein n=1 Tax=Polluticaenibacter yanchengensis TaxID=3014562 RepID=A0ABT4UH11_9BACT|nr:aminoglycoside phosphotransferase family protein [Chitinophagaceae bacterium LY-5]
MTNLLYEVLAEFRTGEGSIVMESLHDGLINDTYKVTIGNNEKYILQRINTSVFKQPELILENISLIGSFLLNQSPEYIFTNPITTITGKSLVYKGDGECYRLMPYIDDSVTYNVLCDESFAASAAEQFGLFTKKLEFFDADQLNITIPDFHNLSMRYQQYADVLNNGNRQKIDACKDIIDAMDSYKWIVEDYEKILDNPAFKKRVTHHDTKISNVLFNSDGKGICVIDLDTVMPGYFISDLGDMMRTYLCEVTEEAQDFSLIAIRPSYFKAVVRGYLKQMASILTDTEKRYIVYAGAFMIYMQALRFFTDYLNDDQYYGAKYPGHNLVRAKNQLRLLESYHGNNDLLNEIVREVITDFDS